MPDIGASPAEEFIAKWRGVTASELSTSQSFLLDLCSLLEVPPPHATPEQDYLFERPVTFQHGDGSTSAGRIDLYRRGAFVLESKKLRQIAQPRGVDEALLRARSQAEQYARALPASEGRPPFIVVVDVGRRIELYAEFSRSGATYTPFPDPRSHRIELDDLLKAEVRERLRRIWLEPLSLDPSREAARVTLAIAKQLANLARSLESSGYGPQAVAQFLMRCLFTMFAEDVRLLPADSFRNLLLRHAEEPDVAMRMLNILWQNMDSGGFSPVLAGDVLRFNGKLFKNTETLPIDKVQLALLSEAARSDWKHVEPAIFGTLLERALSPIERHKLGAHFTPRAYVERLVLPTVIEPLRDEWSDVQAAALMLAADGRPDEAVAELRRFHRRLCTVRVLDPACGSGNFLYVTLEHLKRLEGEVLNALDELGWRQTGLALERERADATAAETVDPHNLLGIEINPRAAAIAEVVLWIGYLQWHFRTHGNVNPPEPVIRDFRNIENRDAILDYDRIEYVIGEHGRPITRWDGRTMKTSPVTGEEIPDENAVVPLERFVNPRKTEWPEADFVVGNPPFIGNKRMRFALGDGYVKALRDTWRDIPESADLVMYWWHHAAQAARFGKIRRFGLITTNSIRQEFNRRVVEAALSGEKNNSGSKERPLSLVFAIPDHPWVDSTDGAAVRISMTVADAQLQEGSISIVTEESEGTDGEVDVVLSSSRGYISSTLRTGARADSANPLRSNENLSFMGVILVGAGFQVDTGDPLLDTPSEVIRKTLNGRDLTQRDSGSYVIDFFGLTENQARAQYPRELQRLLDTVKPERLARAGRTPDSNQYARQWWLFAKPRPEMRAALRGLESYIGTAETAKHRTFSFISNGIIPNQKIRVIASDEPAILGVLSSTVHVGWALVQGSRLGVGNDPVYNNSKCFLTFPFPEWSEGNRHAIGAFGEQLDTHRKRQQASYPDLTLTSMYNVLEKLRSGEPLEAKLRTIHEHGLVSVLRQLHDELDAAVLAAYGWSDLLPALRIAHGNDGLAPGQSRDEVTRAFEEAILERLVALNTERAAEESRGLIRWLRPEFQNRGAQPAPQQAELETGTQPDEVGDESAPSATDTKQKSWPKDPLDQVRAVADILASSRVPLGVDDITARFTSRGPWKRRVEPLLQMLVVLGRASERDGRYRVRV